MEVSGQLQVLSALTPGKNPGTNCIGGWVGPRASLNGFGAEIILSPLMRLKPLMVQLLV